MFLSIFFLHGAEKLAMMGHTGREREKPMHMQWLASPWTSEDTDLRYALNWLEFALFGHGGIS